MKKIVKILSLVCCSFFLFTSCVSRKIDATLLKEPAQATALAYKDAKNDENLIAFRQKAETFAAEFSANVYAEQTKKTNYTVSPVSVFMALSLAAECAEGETRSQILSALGVSHEELQSEISKLYRQLNEIHERQKKETGRIKLTNSIWLSNGFQPKASALQPLAEKYFCYSYQADFLNENQKANQAVRNFIYRETNKLIDPVLNFSKDTLFTLINTLYLKDVWNDLGKDMDMTKENYTFTETGGKTESLKLLFGEYKSGKPYEGETFTSFHVSTYNGYRIQFLLPKEGYTADEIFTAENITEAKNCDYTVKDDDKMEKYYTRCFFPEFSASFDGDVKNVLTQNFWVSDLFDENLCDMTNLSDEPLYCKEVRHITKLKVDRKGIEGAAVTLMPGVGAAAPGEYKRVYLQFIVDKSFGFVLTDYYGTTLFSGVIHTV